MTSEQPPERKEPAGDPAGDTPPASSDPPAHRPEVPDADGWLSLSVRAIWVRALETLAAAIPTALAVVFFGNTADPAFFLVIVVVALTVISTTTYELIRTLTTRYRVTDERIEIRSGLFSKKVESAPRDRIRSVDLTSKLTHQMFSLSVVKIGTGRQQAGLSKKAELVLDAVDTAQAKQLHDELLNREGGAAADSSGAASAPTVDGDDRAGGAAETGAIPTAAQPVTTTASAPPATTRLATFNPAWVFYDLLSAWVLVWPAIVIGGLYGFASQVGGVDGEDTRKAVDFVTRFEVLVVIAVFIVGVLAIGLAAGTVRFFENWGNFDLSREASGNLRIRRGLLTSRAILLEGARIRGVRLLSPLLLRSARGARPFVLTVGMSDEKDSLGASPRALLPSVPAGLARQVATESVGLEPTTLNPELLEPHPALARRRRLGRAAWGSLALAAAGVVAAGPLHLPVFAVVPAALAGVAFMFVAAVGGYRALGHRVTDTHLVVREGFIRERTVALDRGGVIGVHIRQTWFQRRLGLASFHAPTAASGFDYRAHDVTVDEAIDLAETVVPGLSVRADGSRAN